MAHFRAWVSVPSSVRCFPTASVEIVFAANKETAGCYRAVLEIATARFSEVSGTAWELRTGLGLEGTLHSGGLVRRLLVSRE